MRECDVLNDPETSEWLRTALKAALTCDPVRVANDVEVLRSVLQQRAADPVATGIEDGVRFPAEWIPAA